MKSLLYNIPEIPDSFFPRYQTEAQGNVLAAAGSDFERFLRIISSLPPLLSAGIRIVFKPNKTNLQSRLKIYVFAKTNNRKLLQTLQLLLENGPINRFYKLKKIRSISIPYERFHAACDVIRREETIKPLHSSEFNYRIPKDYYKILQFEPNDKNNYLDLDRVLHNIKEMVAIDICIQPANISKELLTHTKYLSQLQSINRIWDDDSDFDFESYNFFKEDTNWSPSRNHNIKPLKYPDPLADDILREQQRFHESLQQPHLIFHVKVLAETLSVAHLIGSIIAESAFDDGSYRLVAYGDEEIFFHNMIESIKQKNIFLAPTRNKYIRKSALSQYDKFGRLCNLSTVDGLLGIFRLPVGSINSLYCICKNTDPPENTNKPFIILGKDKEPPNSKRGYYLKNLTTHMFLCGCSGSTKTNSALNLLLQLHQYDIPFLVIEPVKTEYRILKTLKKSADKNANRLANDLEIYTPGDESVSPFRLNPMDRDNGISKDENIDNILSCIKAAIPIEGSLPALIGEALEQVHEDHPNREKPPVLADLVEATEKVLLSKKYSPDTYSDFRAALDARIGVLTRRSIGKIFQCRHCVPRIDHLMNTCAVIEFNRFHEEQTCLSVLFLLTHIREYLKFAPKSHKTPRYVIIIEEAHNIVGQTDHAIPSSEIANPKAFAAEYVVRMLLELRAIGVGIVIVDQFPSGIAPEVIKSTSSKLAFRQVEKNDREELGASMIFGDIEFEDIARLKDGEAYFITEGYHGPRKIVTPNLYEKYDLGNPVLNQNILPYLTNDRWYRCVFEERIIAELSMLNERMDKFDNERASIRNIIAALVNKRFQLFSSKRDELFAEAVTNIRNEAKALITYLNESFTTFWKESFKKLIPQKNGLDKIDPLVMKMRENLVCRFEFTIIPHVMEMNNILNHIHNESQYA